MVKKHLVQSFLISLVLVAGLASTAAAADYGELVKLYRSGDYAGCIDATTKAIEEASYNESYRVLKIRAELELGRYPDAQATLDAALKQFSYSIQLRWLGREVCRYNKQVERAATLEKEIPDLLRQQSWRYTDVASQMALGEFLLQEGIDPKKVLDGLYKEVKRRSPNSTAAYLACGELALDKQDYALAAQNFQQAIKLDASDPEAHFGLARAFAPSEPEKANAALKAAVELNPHHIGCHLLAADEHIDSERYAEADVLLDEVAKINPHHPLALAYRAVLAHLRNKPEDEQRRRAAALQFWPTNPAVDHLIGRKLSQKYRFAEGARYQRQALEFDPKFAPARMQLAQDLLRMGQEEEGWKLANEVYEKDEYSVLAHNLVTLQDSVTKFRTLEADGILVRMDAREADIYGPRVMALLQRAKQQLGTKYEVTFDRPVVVELFPRQEDFAIRTFGLPGGAGFLGVCFGNVITANSPASQTAHPTCWEATLWHEFCHAVTLHKTNNKMPRWLSEGISVYEEWQANPAWGERINPRYREMMLGDELTPVSQLSGAFLSPKSPVHLQFAYFESSLVVQFLVEKYGFATLQRVLTDLGVGMPINESLGRYAGSVEELDAEFAKYARMQAEAMAPKADWSKPELPRRADVATIVGWLKEHPNNYAALRQLAQQQMTDKQWPEARATLEKLCELCPTETGSGSAFHLLAQVLREMGDAERERAVLTGLAERSDDDVELFDRLTQLALAKEDWKETARVADRWLAVNPLHPEPHRRLARAAEKLSNDQQAIDSYRALLRIDPPDPADLHWKLAGALRRVGSLADARRHALLAVEEAPRFREAHKLLLEIVAEMEKSE